MAHQVVLTTVHLRGDHKMLSSDMSQDCHKCFVNSTIVIRLS